MIWTKVFWKATAERAIKTAAQTAATVIGGNLISAWDLDYGQIAGVSLASAGLSVLTSIGSAKVTDSPGPSLGPEVLDPSQDKHQAFPEHV